MNKIKIASASIVGSVHHKMCYNNQDYYIVEQTDDCIVGLVADGCGSGANSEVGAKLTLRFIVDNIIRKIQNNQEWKSKLESEIVSFLNEIIKRTKVIHEKSFITDNLLFTILGFVINNNELSFFHAGDGSYGINNKIYELDQENKPEYIAYGMAKKNGNFLHFKDFPLGSVNRFLIATDGIDDLFESEIEMNNLFDDSYFYNEVELNAFLHSKMRDGLLRDDTTIIVLRCQ